jgi:hypothetical protein
VFPAQGSHASYFSSSRWFGKSGATGFGCDDTRAPLELVDAELLVLPGDDVPTEGPFAWLSYEGHWGQQEAAFNNGPTGPVSKAQWAAPVTWVADEGRDSAVALPFAGSTATTAFCDLSAAGSMLFIKLLDKPLLVAALLVAAVIAVVLIVRRSSRGVLGRAARAWLADAARHLRVGAVGLIGAGLGAIAQWLLLHFTPLGTLVEALGTSSAWVLPLVGAIGLGVALPFTSWVVAATVFAADRAATARPVSEVASTRRPMIWSSLVALLLSGVAIVVPPVAVLVSRWIAAPVLADREAVTTSAALGDSHRLVRGHAWRALGLLVTMALIAAAAGVLGALVLLLTSATFAVAALVVALAGVVLVPYLALVLVEFTHAISTPDPPARATADPGPPPVTTG